MIDIQVTLNQTIYTLSAGTTLAQLISDIGFPEKGCVFALNEQVIAKSRWQMTTLNDGDQISLFQVIAGG
ncbi:sulfur carrier protein ThiS [Vibrio mangrovi]|uniref:Sulfur carrier protein ThiS n=1 Tax=Vibrio mangrovi TaxID=474394 RepID=A0A1Y6IWH4_9VIBR|nr:sulfur carrier protein ThiS [Vibrio mangrovi]MDW6002446.1 sulfur carrier protein ThiS [Vibrio mangrovi]SMS02025.1 Sulfur carrier protein ThiS [Vibrio mangrovi]